MALSEKCQPLIDYCLRHSLTEVPVKLDELYENRDAFAKLEKALQEGVRLLNLYAEGTYDVEMLYELAQKKMAREEADRETSAATTPASG